MLKILLERKSLMFWCFVRNMNHLKTRVFYLGKKCWRKLTLGHYQFQRTLASPRKGQALFWCQYRLASTPIAFMVANIIKHATVPIWHMTTMNALHFKILPLPMKEDIHCVIYLCHSFLWRYVKSIHIRKRDKQINWLQIRKFTFYLQCALCSQSQLITHGPFDQENPFR